MDAGSKQFWKGFFDDLIDDDIPSLAAGLAYFTTLSLAPLIVLALALVSTLYPDVQERFIEQLGGVVGREGQSVIETIVESASERPDLRQLAGWLSGVVLLVGASAVLAQLQNALNRIWGMKNAVYRGVWGFLRRRVLSVGVLLALLFLTIASLIVQAAVSTLPYFTEGILMTVGWLLSFALYTLLFTTLYRWLPDGRIPWTTALRGGVLTTSLFLFGRWLIGTYLAHSDTAGAYGPAGAIILWLLWAYYSAMVFLLSAELLYALAHHRRWSWWKNSTRTSCPIQKRRSRYGARSIRASRRHPCAS